jgi:DNA-binding CsgD family transcriptional regulator
MQLETSLALMASLSQATDAADLHRRVEKSVRAIGCEHFLIGMEVRLPAGTSVQHIDSGYPEPWQRRYQEKQFVRVDPTVGYCQTHTAPVIWNASMYSEMSHELMEESSSYGLGNGVSIGVHAANSVKSMFSIARDKPFDDEHEANLVKAAGQLIANAVHVKTAELVMPGLFSALAPPLTEREYACLQLAALGKGSGVIADLLNIAEPTVNYHLNKVMKKLGVATRVQAVALAVHLRILR